MDRASAEMTSLRPSGKAPESGADKINAVKEKITALEKAKSELDAAVNNHQRTEARRTALQQSLAKPAVDIAALEKQKSDIDAKVAEYKSSTHEFTTNLDNLLREISALEVAIKNIRETRVKLEKRIAELDGHVKCPYCKSNRQGWKEDHRTELQEELKTVLESESGTDHKLTTIRDHTAGVKGDIALCQKKDAEIANLKNESIRLNNELVIARKSQTNKSPKPPKTSGWPATNCPRSSRRKPSSPLTRPTPASSRKWKAGSSATRSRRRCSNAPPAS
jgi:DNA repair exonuclease SbcCD ATPase subunit